MQRSAAVGEGTSRKAVFFQGIPETCPGYGRTAVDGQTGDLKEGDYVGRLYERLNSQMEKIESALKNAGQEHTVFHRWQERSTAMWNL